MSQIPMQTMESYQPDNLVAGCTQLVSRTGTLAQGQVVARGTLLGQISASGKLTVCLPGATDGSQNPWGIVYDAYDATAADLAGCGCYVAGEFNENAVILGAGWTVAAAFGPMRDAGMYLKSVVTTTGQNV